MPEGGLNRVHRRGGGLSSIIAWLGDYVCLGLLQGRSPVIVSLLHSAIRAAAALRVLRARAHADAEELPAAELPSLHLPGGGWNRAAAETR